MNHTTKCLLFAAGVLGLTSMVASAQQAKPEEKPAATRTLKAKMNYTGAGKVEFRNIKIRPIRH